MAAWMDYARSEVGAYHPLCEKALRRALMELELDSVYEVMHHRVTGSLEMDFAVANRVTKKLLCVIEVKRTPGAVNSMRYQYQAASYVENAYAEMEQPFYVLTNLECSFVFRYDTGRPGVLRQMLQPGLLRVAEFSRTSREAEFMEYLVFHMKGMLDAFVHNRYEYLLTLEEFERHMASVREKPREWKSSLALLLFEYIRGAFHTVSRSTSFKPVAYYRNDVQLVCREGGRVDFKGIFDYSTLHFLKKYPLPGTLLSALYEFGRQNVTGEGVADVLHGLLSEGREHMGEVATDPELADVAAALAKHVYGRQQVVGAVCDPAAGSGSLLSAAARCFAVEPGQLMANDVNERLLELLTLRLGLAFPRRVAAANAPRVSALDVAALPADYFQDTEIILMNPPFLAGILAADRKAPLYDRILDLTGCPSGQTAGQAGLECVFLELICAMAREGTVIACILPKTHLTARSRESAAFRRMLLQEFGLTLVFDYPRLGIFERVTKDTCIIVGRVRRTPDRVKFISSQIPIADIDLNQFEAAVSGMEASEAFVEIMYGVDGRTEEITALAGRTESGFQGGSREYQEAWQFVSKSITPHPWLVRIESLEDCRNRLKRGRNNNKGAKELLYIDLNEEFYEEVSGKLCHTLAGIANADARNQKMDVGAGYCRFFSTRDMAAADIEFVVSAYHRRQEAGGRQRKEIKSEGALKALLLAEQDYAFPAYTVLIPRNIRKYGQVYFTSQDTYVSTNFFCLKMRSEKEAKVTASFMVTVFYQLICEVNQKDQEGARKMEGQQIAATYIPDARHISPDDYARIEAELPHITFLNLTEPCAREIDRVWADILWGQGGESLLEEALVQLQIMVMKRNH